ncbi:MAG: hypothetical protein UT97_C0010G0034 [Parcubacteria group bacterium GW2011_GWC2_40_31]|nr:MAG: hypothetical protein UT97_C0010G0034 [Parcubacteria group bacterium GW2011_GWC2_40_31]
MAVPFQTPPMMVPRLELVVTLKYGKVEVAVVLVAMLDQEPAEFLTCMVPLLSLKP